MPASLDGGANGGNRLADASRRQVWGCLPEYPCPEWTGYGQDRTTVGARPLEPYERRDHAETLASVVEDAKRDTKVEVPVIETEHLVRRLSKHGA